MSSARQEHERAKLDQRKGLFTTGESFDPWTDCVGAFPEESAERRAMGRGLNSDRDHARSFSNPEAVFPIAIAKLATVAQLLRNLECRDTAALDALAGLRPLRCPGIFSRLIEMSRETDLVRPSKDCKRTRSFSVQAIVSPIGQKAGEVFAILKHHQVCRKPQEWRYPISDPARSCIVVGGRAGQRPVYLRKEQVN